MWKFSIKTKKKTSLRTSTNFNFDIDWSLMYMSFVYIMRIFYDKLSKFLMYLIIINGLVIETISILLAL